MTRSQRLYQPAWNQLKNNPTEPLKIAAPKKFHARIIKAITKEKDMDVAYKLVMYEAGKRVRLRTHSDHNLLTFTLTFTVGFEDLGFTPTK